MRRLIALAFAVCIAIAVSPASVAQAAPAGSALPAGYTGGTLPAGTYYLNGNTDLESTMSISGNVTLDLDGYVLRGNGEDPVIDVKGGGSLTIKDSRPTLGHHGNVKDNGIWYWEEGNYSLGGGIIYNRGTGKGIDVSGSLTIEMGKIAGCYSAGIGAAVTVTSSGTFTMNGGQIVYNHSASATLDDSRGGAIYGEPSHNNNGSKVTLTNVLIKGNSSPGNGGGVYGYNVTLTNCIVQENSSELNGGGVYVAHSSDSKDKGRLTVNGCSFIGNTARNFGGGAYGHTGTEISVSGSTTFSGNEAANGGGIYGAVISITGTESNNIQFKGNAAARHGGAVFADEGLAVRYCIMDKNYAGIGGGGFYARCNTTVDNSIISNNRAMMTETYDNVDEKTKVNYGRGGGIYFSGTDTVSPTCKLTNVKVNGNACMYYGGGVQVCTGATLELVSGEINGNESVLHGAGGVHVTSNATFTLTGGEISGNVAHSVGGGIHSSYSCTLNLNGGKIENNITYGRGGGVHVNVGGNLLLKGTKIRGNEALNGTDCYAAKVTLDEDNFATWSDVKDDRSVVKGYGGGVVVDAGTCTMTAGELSGNYAETGGGGIAFVMINTASNERFGENKVVSFDFQGGTISDNTTKGNGAGIYLMKNSWTEEALEGEYGWMITDSTIVDSEGEEIVLTDAGGAVVNIQDILTAIPYVNIEGGTIDGNIATGNGGAAYLEQNTRFYIDGGNITSNKAVNGGAVYVAQGEAFINGGSISGNEASQNGGALYVDGVVTMSDGALTDNSAIAQGGALYVTREKSSVASFTMTSGIMTGNKATGEGSVGGGAYVSGGEVVIGVSGCLGKGETHFENPANKKHPVVANNEAKDSGGGIAAIGGRIYMYCGSVIDNKATNRGRGLNVYMEGGEFSYHAGNVGSLESPELVIVGGTLKKYPVVEGAEVALRYYHCNDVNCKEHEGDGQYPVKVASATSSLLFNLPDGEKYWQAREGFRFYGWTFYGPDNAAAKNQVRSKSDYQPLGTPITATDGVDGSSGDKTIHMYALWAPEKSSISYVGSVIDGVFSAEALAYAAGAPENAATYDFSIESKTTTIYSPQKAGYKFTGWYIYQVEGQNANWAGDNDEYEPAYVSPDSVADNGQEGFDHATLDFSNLTFLSMEGISGDSYELETGGTLFGDIKLIAAFEPAYSSLTIEKAVEGGLDESDEGQAFLFRIQGNPANSSLADIDMTVSIRGVGSVAVEQLPVGSYTVTEVTDWSWRYESSSVSDGANTFNNADSIEISLENLEGAKTITFTNERVNEKWLGGDYLIRNLFKGASGGIAKIASALSGE